MSKMSTLILVKNTEPRNILCFKSEDVADWLATYDGTCVVPDPEDEFKKNFITLTGCIAVDITDLNPMPGVDNGWAYVDNAWVWAGPQES